MLWIALKSVFNAFRRKPSLGALEKYIEISLEYCIWILGLKRMMKDNIVSRSQTSSLPPPLPPAERGPCERGCVLSSRANLRSGVIYLLLWLAREKNNAWYIYLTSHQPSPNLHNLKSAWPAMLLANQRLPEGNQILAGIMSLSKSILGKRKCLKFYFFLWWDTASWSCRTFNSYK